MAGQGDPKGMKVSKGLGPSSLWVPVEYKGQDSARGIPFPQIPACRPLLFFPPPTTPRRQWQLPADAGESRLCLPASPAERARGCSWIEVLICHLQVLCIPRQEISGAKRRLFVTYHRALCRARLLKAIWCLRCPDLWFPSLI